MRKVKIAKDKRVAFELTESGKGTLFTRLKVKQGGYIND